LLLEIRRQVLLAPILDKRLHVLRRRIGLERRLIVLKVLPLHAATWRRTLLIAHAHANVLEHLLV
jgi:hypothetical protein